MYEPLRDRRNKCIWLYSDTIKILHYIIFVKAISNKNDVWNVKRDVFLSPPETFSKKSVKISMDCWVLFWAYYPLSKFWKLHNFGIFELWKLLKLQYISHNLSSKKHSKFNYFAKLKDLKFLGFSIVKILKTA